MGEIADYYVEQAMQDWRGQGGGYRRTPPNHFNPYLKSEDYSTLLRFLTMSLSNEKRLDGAIAKRFILDNLIKRGKFPYPHIRKLNNTELVSLFNIIKNAGLELDGFDEKDLERRIALEEEKERAKMNTQNRGNSIYSTAPVFGFEEDVPTAEVENLFRVETLDAEEGEFSLVIERGMYREVVAVSYSYPHYRKLGFYAGRKANIFSKEADTDKMVINMSEIFESMATLLNNLASADILKEDVYNNVMDGFEPFIYEALDFSEIQSLIGKTSGLKDGKKKRIKARGTKGSSLQNK